MKRLIFLTEEKLQNNLLFECPICLDLIDLDEVVNGIPNSLICDNGHRVHFHCFRYSKKHECPVCRNTHMQFCKSRLGYLYALRDINYHSSEHNSK